MEGFIFPIFLNIARKIFLFILLSLYLLISLLKITSIFSNEVDLSYLYLFSKITDNNLILGFLFEDSLFIIVSYNSLKRLFISIVSIFIFNNILSIAAISFEFSSINKSTISIITPCSIISKFLFFTIYSKLS